MKSRLMKLWEDLRSSYWFVPTLMALVAVGLSVLMVEGDRMWGVDWLEGVPWLSANKPAGARELLSTIAGSMITVAGVTFSITIAAVAYAASQFGPRLLTNFMRDRGNQVTLGTFIATFIYCLLVLRSIREGDGEELFVPHAAILLGLLLTMMSVAVLIYFIHHVPESIHASNVVAALGRELDALIAARHPTLAASAVLMPRALGSPPALPEAFYRQAAPVLCKTDGYVQYLDEDALLRLATEGDLLVRIEHRPGDFVRRGRALLLAWPPENLHAELAHELAGSFAIGERRTPRQDILFLAQELVEIATRALSPMINDPFTATACMERLACGMSRLAEREVREAALADEEGNLRLLTRPTTLAVFAERTLGRLRPYVQKDRNAAIELMRVLGELTESLRRPDQRALLRHHAKQLHRGAMAALDEDSARVVDERFRVVLRLLDDPDAWHEIAACCEWLSGREAA